MFIRTMLLLGCCLYYSCQTSPPPPTSPTQSTDNTTTAVNTWLLKGGESPQAGEILPNTTEKEVSNLFGKENVSQDTIFVADMEPFIGTSLYKGTANELQIIWTDAKHEHPEVAITRQKGQWHSPKGIKVGMTLAELVQLNDGKAIQFSGFGWDYGGNVTNWNGGALEQEKVMVKLQEGEISPDLQKLYQSVLGDGVFSSDTKDIEKLGITVGEISISLNKPQ
ncbi:MAG TPA: hypothetical protein PK230_10365 [Chitinophagales bacterium]|nr:hypothetical protein [Chitinophagales bacterium]